MKTEEEINDIFDKISSLREDHQKINMEINKKTILLNKRLESLNSKEEIQKFIDEEINLIFDEVIPSDIFDIILARNHDLLAWIICPEDERLKDLLSEVLKYSSKTNISMKNVLEANKDFIKKLIILASKLPKN